MDLIIFDEVFWRLIGYEGGYSIDWCDFGNWIGGKVGVGILKGIKYGIVVNIYFNLDIKNFMIV